MLLPSQHMVSEWHRNKRVASACNKTLSLTSACQNNRQQPWPGKVIHSVQQAPHPSIRAHAHSCAIPAMLCGHVYGQYMWAGSGWGWGWGWGWGVPPPQKLNTAAAQDGRGWLEGNGREVQATARPALRGHQAWGTTAPLVQVSLLCQVALGYSVCSKAGCI